MGRGGAHPTSRLALHDKIYLLHFNAAATSHAQPGSTMEHVCIGVVHYSTLLYSTLL